MTPMRQPIMLICTHKSTRTQTYKLMCMRTHTSSSLMHTHTQLHTSASTSTHFTYATHAHVHAHTCTYRTCTLKHTSACTCTHTHAYMHTNKRMYKQTHIPLANHMHKRMYIHGHTRTCSTCRRTHKHYIYIYNMFQLKRNKYCTLIATINRFNLIKHTNYNIQQIWLNKTQETPSMENTTDTNPGNYK